MKTQHVGFGLILVVIGTLLVGCAEKLTYEHWRTLENGMRQETVRATIGDPWQTFEKEWHYYDSDRGINVTVYYNDDWEVVGTTWSSPERTEGSSPHVNDIGDAEETRIQTIE